ncbi:MAG: hypothetical protein AAFW00_05635 [Bacteroidota bacterium]
MKNLTVILTLLAFVFAPMLVDAQVSKEEKKFWKRKAKTYAKNPLTLKAEFENYQEQIKDLKQRNIDLMSQASSSQGGEAEDSLKWALIQAESQLERVAKENNRLKEELRSQKSFVGTGNMPGLVYRIQIGAYVFFQADNIPSGSGEIVAERADGFNKYLLGAFRDYDESIAFRDELREMGMKDAWVVPYIDGVRVSMEEANAYQQNPTSANILDD